MNVIVLPLASPFLIVGLVAVIAGLWVGRNSLKRATGIGLAAFGAMVGFCALFSAWLPRLWEAFPFPPGGESDWVHPAINVAYIVIPIGAVVISMGLILILIRLGELRKPGKVGWVLVSLGVVLLTVVVIAVGFVIATCLGPHPGLSCA